MFIHEEEHVIPIHLPTFMRRLKEVVSMDFWYGGRWVPVVDVTSFCDRSHPHIMFTFQYCRSVALPTKKLDVHQSNRYLLRVSLKSEQSFVWEII